MARKPEDSLSQHKNTAARRQLIDYDYINQLSPEELEWLAKFSDEFYGGDFEINPTFCKKEDALKVCAKELGKLDTESKTYKKWLAKLNHIKTINETFVQISGNSDKKHNLDLRKCRSIKLFRKNENGNLSQKPEYKYNSIHDFEEFGKDCNTRSGESARDIFSVQRVIKQEANEYCVDNHVSGGFLPEEHIIREEVEDELEFYESAGLIKIVYVIWEGLDEFMDDFEEWDD